MMGQLNFICFYTVVFFHAIQCEWMWKQTTSSFETEDVFQEELFFNLGKVLAINIVLDHHTVKQFF